MWMVAGSIPDVDIGIYNLHNPSGRTIALRSTQPLTEMSTMDFSWGVKGGRCVRLTLPLLCADCLEIRAPDPCGTFRACSGIAVPTRNPRSTDMVIQKVCKCI